MSIRFFDFVVVIETPLSEIGGGVRFDPFFETVHAHTHLTSQTDELLLQAGATALLLPLQEQGEGPELITAVRHPTSADINSVSRLSGLPWFLKGK